VRLTKHEALPTEVLVRLGISDLLMKLNGVWNFTNIESRQVGYLVMPGIPLPQRIAVAHNFLIHIGNVMFVDKVHDVVRLARLGRLRRTRMRRERQRFTRGVTRKWIAPFLPVFRAFLQLLNHLQLGL
jgi:hypothetical protein